MDFDKEISTIHMRAINSYVEKAVSRYLDEHEDAPLNERKFLLHFGTDLRFKIEEAIAKL